MSSESFDRELLDDDPMPLDVIPELDENVINNSLINLSNEVLTLSQPNVGNHNSNLKGKQTSKNATLHILPTLFPPPPPPNQPKIPHISNKPNNNQYDSLPDNRYSVHNKGPYFVTVEPVNHVSKHPILIGQILHSSFPGIIKNISKSNFSRVDVECYDGKGANKIAESNKTSIIITSKLSFPIIEYQEKALLEIFLSKLKSTT